MRHRVAKYKLSRPTEHRMMMLRNLVTDLLKYEKITTTEAKAKAARSLAEKVITLGKKGDLHSRRQALKLVIDKKVVEKVFKELSERYAARNSGYTRILKLGHRPGDNAPMVQLELVK